MSRKSAVRGRCKVAARRSVRTPPTKSAARSAACGGGGTDPQPAAAHARRCEKGPLRNTERATVEAPKTAATSGNSRSLVGTPPRVSGFPWCSATRPNKPRETHPAVSHVGRSNSAVSKMPAKVSSVFFCVYRARVQRNEKYTVNRNNSSCREWAFETTKSHFREPSRRRLLEMR